MTIIIVAVVGFAITAQNYFGHRVFYSYNAEDLECVHGWPFIYLVRSGVYYAPHITPASIWDITQGYVTAFKPWLLTANLAISVLLLYCVAYVSSWATLFRRWRLRTLLLSCGMASLFFAFMSVFETARREQDATKSKLRSIHADFGEELLVPIGWRTFGDRRSP
jgi:hypothetical protein